MNSNAIDHRLFQTSCSSVTFIFILNYYFEKCLHVDLWT